MSEKTGIAWCDSTVNLLPKTLAALQPTNITRTVCLKMNGIMTTTAKRKAIGDDKPKCWEFGERLNVMSTKVATFGVPALLAGEFVAGENRVAPVLITRVAARSNTPFVCSVFPVVMFFASRVMKPAILAHSALCFLRQPLSKPAAFAFERGRNLGLSFGRMMMSFERRRHTVTVNADFDAATLEARRINSVSASSVFSKLQHRLPYFTAGATLLARVNQRFELLKSKASIFSRELHRSDFGLCHS